MRIFNKITESEKYFTKFSYSIDLKVGTKLSWNEKFFSKFSYFLERENFQGNQSETELSESEKFFY